MIRLVIISAFLFIAGNVSLAFHNEYKVFWVPLAFHLLMLTYYIGSKQKDVRYRIVFKYLTVLAIGNLIKQIFYTDTIGQINDYVLGGIATIILIVKLWANRNKH